MSCCRKNFKRESDLPLKDNIIWNSEYDDVEKLIKMVVVGDSGVGKTSMLLRLVDNAYYESIGSTIGVDFKTYQLEVNDRKFKVMMWDTAGQERFGAITDTYFRGMHAIFIVYDVTNKESYDRILFWLKKARVKEESDFEIIVVGTKMDILDENKKIDISNLEELVGPHQHVLVSARANTGFNSLIKALAVATNNVIKKEWEAAQRRNISIYGNKK